MVWVTCPNCHKLFRLTWSGTDKENEEEIRKLASGERSCPYCGYNGTKAKEKVVLT